MISDKDVDNFLEHYGVKGMKWGIRNDRRSGGSGTRYEKKQARKTVGSLRKSARSTIKEHRKASSSAERKSAQERYKKEVVDKVKTKDFKDAYIRANTMGKGEIAARTIISGPLAPLTYVTLKNINSSASSRYNLEVAVAKEVLNEMKSIRPVSPQGATRAGARALREREKAGR